MDVQCYSKCKRTFAEDAKDCAEEVEREEQDAHDGYEGNVDDRRRRTPCATLRGFLIPSSPIIPIFPPGPRHRCEMYRKQEKTPGCGVHRTDSR